MSLKNGGKSLILHVIVELMNSWKQTQTNTHFYEHIECSYSPFINTPPPPKATIVMYIRCILSVCLGCLIACCWIWTLIAYS